MKTRNHTTSWFRRIWRSIRGTNNHKHDWLLVYSMAAFNFDGGWQQSLLKCQAQNT